MKHLRAIFLMVFSTSMVCLGSSLAMDGGKPVLVLELNNAQQMKTDCRLSFVVRNNMPSEISELSLEVVLFDDRGLVDRFLKLKAGRLPVGKIRVKQYDLKQKTCTGLSKILINDVSVCKGGNLSPQSCLKALSLGSRTAIQLVM